MAHRQVEKRSMDNYEIERMMKEFADRLDNLDGQVRQLKDDRLCRESVWDVDDEGEIKSRADLWDKDRGTSNWS